MIAGVVIAVMLIGGAVTAIYVVARSPGKSASSGSSGATDKVRIEVRSMPAMTIQKDGLKLGTTPLTFLVPKSITPVTLQADWVEQRIYRDGPREVPRTATKTVVPDHDQVIDFTRRDK